MKENDDVQCFLTLFRVTFSLLVVYMNVKRQKNTVLIIKKLKVMGFIICCIVYIVICQAIVKMFKIEQFKWQALVYAIVGNVGGFIIKAILS